MGLNTHEMLCLTQGYGAGAGPAAGAGAGVGAGANKGYGAKPNGNSSYLLLRRCKYFTCRIT